MNYQQKIAYQKSCKDQFRVNYPEGTAKWSNETLEHFTTKCQLLYYFKVNGYSVWTEVSFKDGGRADLVCLKDNHAYVVEVIKSEKEKSILLKKVKYPEMFEFITVDAETFNYNEFKL